MFTNVTLLYFVLLIPLSGFIAWLGDRIGHKSGKRRHTLFGLRPRHTAMVFTVGTGMCISLVSFLLVFLFSATFRMIVRDGVRLYDTNRELKHSNIALTQGNERLARIAQQRKVDAELADRKRETAYKAAAAADLAAKAATDAENRALANQKKAETEVAKAMNLLSTEKRFLQTAQTRLGTAQARLLTVQNTLKARNTSLYAAELQVADARKDVSQATGRVKAAQKDAEAAQANVDHVRAVSDLVAKEQATQLAQRNKALADLQKQFDDQSKLYDSQKTATDQQRLELTRLNTQVADSEIRLRQIQRNTEALRGNRITYQVNEEVDRVAIKPGYNVWRIEAILGSFVSGASKKAEMRGARRDSNGDSALVVLPEATTANAAPVKPKSKNINEDLWMDERIRAAAESIRSANTDTVVLVTAVANAVAGEPVAVSLNWYKNPIVFPADTQIGDAHINGKGSPEEIADALDNFLRQDVRSTLLHAGVIPKSSGDGSESVPSIGSLRGDDLVHIMDRIRLAGDNARVVVTASQDMRAGDYPVPLHFDVKNVPAALFRE